MPWPALPTNLLKALLFSKTVFPLPSEILNSVRSAPLSALSAQGPGYCGGVWGPTAGTGWLEVVARGIPVISPVLAFKTRPVGKEGLTEKVSIIEPLVVGRMGFICCPKLRIYGSLL